MDRAVELVLGEDPVAVAVRRKHRMANGSGVAFVSKWGTFGQKDSD